jgi:hypothetical protein
LFPYGTSQPEVFALSVFGRWPGWMSRSLTSAELAAVYDLPVRLQKSRWSEESLPFLDSVPSKVLMAFREDILRMTGEETPRMSVPPLSTISLLFQNGSRRKQK